MCAACDMYSHAMPSLQLKLQRTGRTCSARIQLIMSWKAFLSLLSLLLLYYEQGKCTQGGYLGGALFLEPLGSLLNLFHSLGEVQVAHQLHTTEGTLSRMRGNQLQSDGQVDGLCYDNTLDEIMSNV